MIFYLKANRSNSYVIPNIKHWLDAVMLYENGYAYILCDNMQLKEQIIKEIMIDDQRVSFIESDRDNEEINYVLNNICKVDKWIRVGQAHLTTHWHATEMNYQCFWNVDADDTFVCLDPIRMVKMFKEVEKYAERNSISMFSLDMWHSMSVNEHWSKGDNWSLGVVYVDNRQPWCDILKRHCKDSEYLSRTFPYDKDINLDWYFTYLRDSQIMRIETFYFENLKFMHFYDYFFNYPHLSSFSHWENGFLEFPILKACFGSRSRSKILIAPDCVKLDISILDDEALLSMIAPSREVFSFWFDIRDCELEVGEVMNDRCKLFLDSINRREIICWGAGAFFHRNLQLIKKIYDVKLVCDSDSKKWGKEVDKGIICISPDDLKAKRDDVFILLMIDSPAVNIIIVRRLLELGIDKFDHFDNWIEIVTGAVDIK